MRAKPTKRYNDLLHGNFRPRRVYFASKRRRPSYIFVIVNDPDPLHPEIRPLNVHVPDIELLLNNDPCSVNIVPVAFVP